MQLKSYELKIHIQLQYNGWLYNGCWRTKSNIYYIFKELYLHGPMSNYLD